MLRTLFCPFFTFSCAQLLTLTFAMLALGASSGAAASSRPNIVFIMADDLGWADVAFHGGNVPTPHLDRLAREGVELTHHYVAPTCSPTRAGLLTGRYGSRFGINGPDNRRALPSDILTLPRALKATGYATALIGKWHLGSKPAWGPNYFGFDYSYGSLAGGVGPYDHFYKEGEFIRTWHRNGELITEEGHVTDLMANEAVAWLNARTDAPFFLYVPFAAVHLPLKEPQAWLDRVPASIQGDVPRHYAACIMHLDDAVGRIIAALEKARKRDRTLVIFTSDNGGSTAENDGQAYPKDGYPKGRIPGNNQPLRGQKGDLYEGGIRVPTIANWPGQLRPGKLEMPLHIVDWMPTLCTLAGAKLQRPLNWDGHDLWPLISGQSTSAAPKRVLYWRTPKSSAVRRGHWKLIVHSARDTPGAKVELFDLAQDPHETTDLAHQRPEVVATLKQTLTEIAEADGDARVKE